jgi:integrase/recombinase XerD
MTPLRRRMLEDLQLRGLAPKTQQCYLDAVRQLAHHYHRPPDQLSDEELRQYFLSWRHEKKVAESTFRIHLYGIRFFYELTLKRPWPVFDLVRPRNIQKLPVVLSPRDVRDLLALVRNPTAQMCLRLIYACGLRLREGTQLQVSAIDPQRMLVRVRQSGLAKDASIHTRRHSDATHLVERGVSLRVMQDLLGHKSPSTTARSTHLTPPTLDVVHATITALMADL